MQCIYLGRRAITDDLTMETCVSIEIIQDLKDGKHMIMESCISPNVIGMLIHGTYDLYSSIKYTGRSK